MGKTNDIITRLKNLYGDMVDSQDYSTTLWEYFTTKDTGYGSKNHAWSGSPLIIMSKYIAGIQPLDAGFKKILIKPSLGSLNEVSSQMKTEEGLVSVNINKQDNKCTLKLELPNDAKIAVPKFDGDRDYKVLVNLRKVYKNKESFDNSKVIFDSEDESYIYFSVKKGNYTITIK